MPGAFPSARQIAHQTSKSLVITVSAKVQIDLCVIVHTRKGLRINSTSALSQNDRRQQGKRDVLVLIVETRCVLQATLDSLTPH